MTRRDPRTRSPDTREDLRFRVVTASRNGRKKSAAARSCGVSRTLIDARLVRVEVGNVNPLRSKKRGRPPEPRLAGHPAATIVKRITDRTPDQLRLAFAPWTRAALRDLSAQRYAIHVSVRTVGRYLQRWGFTPRKPLRRAYERDPVAVQRWLDEEYPAIARQAQAEKAEIHGGAQRASGRAQLRTARADAGDSGYGAAFQGQRDVEQHQSRPAVFCGFQGPVQR